MARKKKTREVTQREQKMMRVACEYFTDHVTSNFYKEVRGFIITDMMQIGCCVMWSRDSRFVAICQRNGIDPGNKEVRITENWGAVRGTPNWGRYAEDYLYHE